MNLLAFDIGSDIEQIFVAVMAAGIIALIAGGVKLFRRMDAQDALMGENKRTLARLEARQDREFNGNSGGLREAINGVTSRLDDHISLHERQR